MKVKGMMATSHAIVSLCLLCLFMLIPVSFFRDNFFSLVNEPLKFFFTLVTFLGFALLVDLDNNVSKAGSELGVLGNMVTVFMQSTSGIVYGLYHFRGDRPPRNQHRYLWHTPFIFGCMLALFYFGIPQVNETMFSAISKISSEGNIFEGISKQAVVILYLFMSFIATVVGSDLVLRFFRKFVRIPWWGKYILSVITLGYILFQPLASVRQMAIVCSFGYLFHILEDAVCDSGIPLLWPIPLGSQVWRRIKLIPITITTGGVSNKIVEIVATVLAPFLLYYVFSLR